MGKSNKKDSYKALVRKKPAVDNDVNVIKPFNENHSQDSLLEIHTIKALEEAHSNAVQISQSANQENSEKEEIILNPILIPEDLNLEDFFSDEDE